MKIKGEVGYKALTPIMRVLFRIWYNPKIIGKEKIPKKGSIIIVCNHKHVLDQCPIIMSTKRVLHYMAKKEYFDGKLKWFFKLVGCIPVDRSIHDNSAKEKALEVLNSSGAIGLFPEGTRNKTYDTLLLPFKFGAVSMAKKTGATIIPSAITGDYCFRSKNLILRFGTPFKVSKEDNLEEVNNKLYEEMTSLIKQNLKETNRTLEEELSSRNQDQKKKKE